jgi:hypothetical protein
MKVIEQTNTRLVIADQNRQWLWGTLFGVPFMVIGITVAWLHSMGQSGDRWQALIYGSMFFVPGLVVLIRGLLTPMQTLAEFDKPLHQLTLEKRYRLKGKQITLHPLNQVKQAYFLRTRSSSQKTVWYGVKLELAVGGAILLSPPLNRREAIRLTDTINHFLGVDPA